MVGHKLQGLLNQVSACRKDRQNLIQKLLEEGPEDLEAPGVSAFKKVETWDKWFKIADQVKWLDDGAEWEKWCPKPTAEERSKVKSDRKKRALVREEEKKAIESIEREQEVEDAISSDEDEANEDGDDEHINWISSHATFSPYASSYRSPNREGSRKPNSTASTPNTRSPTKKKGRRNKGKR